MKSWGNHEGYRYAHDWPGAVAPQQYMPDELAGREYYHPNDRGYEHEINRDWRKFAKSCMRRTVVKPVTLIEPSVVSVLILRCRWTRGPLKFFVGVDACLL